MEHYQFFHHINHMFAIFSFSPFVPFSSYSTETHLHLAHISLEKTQFSLYYPSVHYGPYRNQGLPCAQSEATGE